jgi:hypothetical protein
MAAIRMLFDLLVTGGVLEHNQALSVVIRNNTTRKSKV